ncbi:MAG: SPOR domain-containing protein [Woeseiaceae bacterium]
MKIISNHLFKTMFFSFLILISHEIQAVTNDDAVLASKNSNPIQAVKIWTQLASAGNSTAQYNLAQSYSSGIGITKNEDSASRLLKNATKSGLVEAYLNLNKGAIAPAKGITLSFDVIPDTWLEKQEAKQYTIQIASSRNKKSIIRTFEENGLAGKGDYFHYKRDGMDRYGLVYGAYKTVAAANLAIKKLAPNLLKKQPWVRRIRSVQKVSQ